MDIKREPAPFVSLKLSGPVSRDIVELRLGLMHHRL